MAEGLGCLLIAAVLLTSIACGRYQKFESPWEALRWVAILMLAGIAFIAFDLLL